MTRIGKLMVWWMLATTGVALLSAPAAAAGRPLRHALDVQRGAACLSRDALAAQIAAWLGKETIDRDLSVRVVASPSDGRDVTFELRRGAELLTSRRFRPAPADCAALEAILALAIAMALEVSLRDELLASLDGATGKPHPWQSSLAMFAELGFGVLPGVSGGAAMRLRLRAHRLVSLRFDGLVHASPEHALAGAPVAVGVTAWLAGMRATACLLVPFTRALLASACAGLGGGSLRIEGRGYEGARGARLPWVDVLAGAELSVALARRWSIDAGANVALPLGDRGFGVHYADGTLAASYTLPAVAATLRAGPAYYF